MVSYMQLDKINNIYMESSLSKEEQERITRKFHTDMIAGKIKPQYSLPSPKARAKATAIPTSLNEPARKVLATALTGLVIYLLYSAVVPWI